jgi:hypothetical protein
MMRDFSAKAVTSTLSAPDVNAAGSRLFVTS